MPYVSILLIYLSLTHINANEVIVAESDLKGKINSDMETLCKQGEDGVCWVIGSQLKTAGKINSAKKYFQIGCKGGHQISCIELCELNGRDYEKVVSELSKDCPKIGELKLCDTKNQIISHKNYKIKCRELIVSSIKFQTTINDPCSNNKQCFCQVYDGKKFYNKREKEHYKCCLIENGCKDLLKKPVPFNKCFPCYYE